MLPLARRVAASRLHKHRQKTQHLADSARILKMLIYFSFSFLASFPCLSFMYLAVLYIYSALFLASFLFLYFFFSLLNSFCLIIHRLSSYSLRLFLFVTFCTYLLFLLLSFRFLFVVFFTSPFLYSFVQLLSSLPYQRRSKH